MATEIERKFLVVNERWRAGADAGTRIIQGYLANNANCTVRVRIKGEQALLTVKGPTRGISRVEYEYPIPLPDAEAMLRQLAAGPVIDKTRFRVPCDGHLWEVDEFHGDNAGLMLAEIELGAEDEAFTRPDWAGTEVSGDSRYYNVNLARNPYQSW